MAWVAGLGVAVQLQGPGGDAEYLDAEDRDLRGVPVPVQHELEVVREGRLGGADL